MLAKLEIATFIGRTSDSVPSGASLYHGGLRGFSQMQQRWLSLWNRPGWRTMDSG